MQTQIIKLGLWGLASLGMLVILMAQPQEAQAKDSINLKIGGNAGTAYSAHWMVETAGQTREYYEVNGQVPTQLHYNGDAISGTVRLLSEGQLTLTVEKSGNRSRSATQGKGSTLQFSVR